MTTEPNVTQAVPFFGVHDMGASLRFYVDGLGNGMWVTSVTDPDGYALFFESPTDAPEESVYNE